MGSLNTISSPILPAEKNKITFEELYLQVRRHENRIYTDKEVALLPSFYLDHPLAKEWRIRKNSSEDLIKYLVKKNKPLEILEIGCGNGWLSARLSSILASHVTGIDINAAELDQAKRVFNKIRNLEFFNCDLRSELLYKKKFDIIVFAASIQYFPSLENVLKDTFDYLKQNGEIHILDSHFYETNKIEAAKKRSIAYYESIGFPEMADFYFHHSLNELKQFNYKIIFNPGFFLNKLKKNKNPFYWISITNHA